MFSGKNDELTPRGTGEFGTRLLRGLYVADIMKPSMFILILRGLIMGTTTREFQADALMEFGCGFDALSGDVKGSAVRGTAPSEASGGAETVFSLYRVETVRISSNQLIYRHR